MKEAVYDHLLILKNTEIWPTSNFERNFWSYNIISSGLIRHESYGVFTYISRPSILKSYPRWSKKHLRPSTLWIPKPFVPFVPWLPSINDKIHMFPKSPGKWLNFNFVHPNISGKVLSWRLPWPTCGRSPQGVHVDPENTDTIAIGWLKEQKGLKLEVAGLKWSKW